MDRGEHTEIDGATTVVGVIGDAVRVSLSPRLQNAAFAALGLNWCYVGFRVPRERALAAAMAVEMYADSRAMPLLTTALAQVPDEVVGAVLTEMRLLAPGVAAAVEPAGVA